MFDEEYTRILAHELAHRSLAQVIVETGLLVVIALTALVSNSCVLYVFYKTPRLRSVTSYYIITLAIADVVMSLAIMPTSVAILACGRDVLDEAVGHVVGFIFFSLVSGSITTTTLIAVNRYFCVTKQRIYKKLFRPKLAKIMIIGVWVLTLCVITITDQSGIGKLQFSPGLALYYPIYFHKLLGRIHLILSVVIIFVLPFSLAVICYLKIYKTVRGHHATVSSSLSTSNSEILSKEEIHISKSVLAVVLSFVFCWIPSVMVISVYAYHNLPREMLLFATYAAYLSGALNPIAYNVFNTPFRRKFMLVCSFNQRNSETVTSRINLKKIVVPEV